MIERDPEEFHECGCRVRRNQAYCPIHDFMTLRWDEPDENETLPPIPDSMVPEWVDRVEEFDDL